MIKLYHGPGTNNVNELTLIGEFENQQEANKAMVEHAHKNNYEVYYVRQWKMEDNDKVTVCDYGSWSDFCYFEEVD